MASPRARGESRMSRKYKMRSRLLQFRKGAKGVYWQLKIQGDRTEWDRTWDTDVLWVWLRLR